MKLNLYPFEAADIVMQMHKDIKIWSLPREITAVQLFLMDDIRSSLNSEMIDVVSRRPGRIA